MEGRSRMCHINFGRDWETERLVFEGQSSLTPGPIDLRCRTSVGP